MDAVPLAQAQAELVAERWRRMSFAPLKIEPFGPLHLGGLRKRHYFNGDYNKVSEDIATQWRALVPMMWRIPKLDPPLGYSVGLHAPDAMMALDFFYGFVVAGEVANMTGIATLDLVPFTAAVFEHRQHISLVPATIGHAFGSELPNAGLGPDGESPIAFVLRTLPSFNPLTGNGGVELLIPVKPH